MIRQVGWKGWLVHRCESAHYFQRVCIWAFGSYLFIGLACASAAETIEMAKPTRLPTADDLAGYVEPDQANAPRQAMDGREVGCRAARNWKPAEILRARARTLVQLYGDEDECARAAAHTLSNFLRQQAARQEEIGAATAMRAYYSRIAVAQQLAVIEESLELIQVAQDQQVALREGGLAAVTDVSALARQRLEVVDKRLQLESQDRQLSSLLRQLSGLNYANDDVVLERLEVYKNSLDCARLKQLALGQRHDLCGWRLLARAVNSETAPEFAKMIPTLVGGWALPLPSLKSLRQILCTQDYSCLAANMKRELDMAVALQEDWVGQSVDEKCNALQLSYERIEIAKQIVASWSHRLKQLQRLEESGDGKPEQRAIAESELLKSRSDEISRRLESRLAEIDLSEAVGGLAERCCRGEAWLTTGY